MVCEFLEKKKDRRTNRAWLGEPEVFLFKIYFQLPEVFLLPEDFI